MLNEIEKVEVKHSKLYKEVDRKIEDLMAKNPSMIKDLLDLESLFLDINIKAEADMYIAGYIKGREMVLEELDSKANVNAKSLKFFRRKISLKQAK